MQQNQHYLPIIGIEELSSLLKRSKEVIKKDRSDPARKHTLPPAFKPDGTKNPLWVTEDVISWLRQHPEEPNILTKKIGAPTKLERIKKRLELELAGTRAAITQSNQ